MIEKPCNYCGRQDVELVNEGPDLLLNRPTSFRLVRCLNCGLIYQNPQLTLAELPAQYPDHYISYYEGIEQEASPFTRVDRRRGMNRRCRRVINHRSQPGHLLDVGCATGLFLAAMRDRGWQTTGVELSEYAADYARRIFDLEIKTGTLEAAAFPDDTFDMVTLWDVFEHVLDPKATLLEIGRILKPGGLLVMSLPNPTAFEATLFGDSWVGWDRPRHLHLFTPLVIENYLTTTGFKLDGIESFSGRWGTTLLSFEFRAKARGVPEARWRPWLKFLHNWPLRLLTLPLYWIGEALNKTTDMTVFATYPPQ